MSEFPNWVFDLLIAVLDHEDTHDSGQVCLRKVTDAVPREYREQARAIAEYKRWELES